MTEPRLDPRRWAALWRRLGAPAPSHAFPALEAAYGAPERRYHGTAHILACLAHFDDWRHLARQPDQVELALWTHDLVYDTHRQDNEAASADVAAGWLTEAGLTRYVAPVSELILATCHREPPLHGDAGLVVDLDLAILASEPTTYHHYETAIRAEYAWVPEPLFRTGRGALLRQLLAMPALYWHGEIRERWEAPARRNLAWALDALDKV